MVTPEIQEAYIAILREELVPATGCTEPIAIAYGAAKLRQVLSRAPERILACLYNAFLIPAASSGDARKKGDPDAIVRRFSGRPLSELRDALWQELIWLFVLPPPKDLLAPLDKKLENGVADKPFRLTKREITLVSNRGRKSAQKKHDEIVGGTLDE